MTLASEIREHIAAGFSGLYVKTFEPDDATHEIGALSRNLGWNCLVWDIDSGLQGTNEFADDPLSMVKALPSLCLADGSPTVLIMRYLHRMIGNPSMLSAIENVLRQGKAKGFHLVIVAPEVSLPIELSRSFVVLEHSLPDRETLQTIASEIAESDSDLPSGDDLETLLDAAQGLTRCEAENAFALSLVRHQKIQADTVFSLKAQALTKTGYLRLSTSKRRFDDLGGLANIKDFCLRVLSPNPNRIGNPQGVLALGPPGTGKTAFAEALGNECGLPTVILDIGSLKGSLVGQSEERTRHAIATINAMGRCIVFIDEVERALAGASGNGQNDSGVSSGIFGTFLTWLSDPDRQAFIVATSNDIRSIPPQFSRSGRFDGVFFWDLPGREQKDKIWDIYIGIYRLDPAQDKPLDADWTGADIQSCCQKANMLGISLAEASRYVVPIAKRSKAEIESLREWCDGTTTSAEYPDTYRRNPAQSIPATGKATRRIDRSSAE